MGSGEVGTGVAEGGEAEAPLVEGGDGEPGGEDGGVFAGVEEDFAQWIEDEAASGVGMGWVLAAAVDADDEGLVFDGAGAEEGDPMVDAGGGPIGDDGEELGPAADGLAEGLGEAEVVADQGGDLEFLPGKEGDLVAGGIMEVFAAEGEGMEFGEASEEGSLGVEGQGLVAGLAVRAAGGHAGDERDAVLDGELAEELFGGAVGGFGGGGCVHAKPGGEHFREDHQTIGGRRGGLEGGGGAVVVGARVFPDQVELTDGDVQAGGGQGERGCRRRDGGGQGDRDLLVRGRPTTARLLGALQRAWSRGCR